MTPDEKKLENAEAYLSEDESLTHEGAYQFRVKYGGWLISQVKQFKVRVEELDRDLQHLRDNKERLLYALKQLQGDCCSNCGCRFCACDRGL